jgi:hypothetical protein
VGDEVGVDDTCAVTGAPCITLGELHRKYGGRVCQYEATTKELLATFRGAMAAARAMVQRRGIPADNLYRARVGGHGGERGAGGKLSAPSLELLKDNITAHKKRWGKLGFGWGSGGIEPAVGALLEIGAKGRAKVVEFAGDGEETTTIQFENGNGTYGFSVQEKYQPRTGISPTRGRTTAPGHRASE